VTGLGSLKKGTVVAVYGTVTTPGHITATRITAGFGGPGRGRFGGGRGTFGAIASIGSTSFTIASFSGTKETVDVSSATVYEGAQGTLNGLSALKTGEDVVVQGTVSGSSVTATLVRVVQPGGFGGGFGSGFGGGAATGGAGTGA
jgi:hypothetical protein